MGKSRRGKCDSKRVNRVLIQGLAWMSKYGDALQQEPKFRELIEVIENQRMWLCGGGLIYAFACMPVYVILKQSVECGILSHQYTWVTTLAFLHGYASAGIVAAFVCFSQVLLVHIICTS